MQPRRAVQVHLESSLTERVQVLIAFWNLAMAPFPESPQAVRMVENSELLESCWAPRVTMSRMAAMALLAMVRTRLKRLVTQEAPRSQRTPAMLARSERPRLRFGSMCASSLIEFTSSLK